MSNAPLDPRDRTGYRDDVTRAYDTPRDQGAYGDEPFVVREHDRGFPGGAMRNGLGTAALVLGILALLSSWTVVGGILLGVAAIICGAIALGRVKRGEANNRGSAMAGLVLGALSLLIAGGLALAGANFINDNKEEFDNLNECTTAATTDAARNACAEQFKDSVTN